LTLPNFDDPHLELLPTRGRRSNCAAVDRGDAQKGAGNASSADKSEEPRPKIPPLRGGHRNRD
jgi:hypothetical protein